jgi:hypothetical protein
MREPLLSNVLDDDAEIMGSRQGSASDKVVEIGDIPLLLRASDISRATAMTELLDRLPRSGRAPMASLAFTERRDPCPPRVPDEVHDGLLIWRNRDGESCDLVMAHSSGLTVTVSGGDAHIGGDCERLDVCFRRLFPLALCPILAVNDRILLHAGAFLGSAGGVLALGPTGSGKSTLVLAADRAGLPCLADDLVVLRAGGNIEVQGVPRPLAVPGDVVAATPHHRKAQALLDDDRGRFLLTDLRLAGGWFPVAGTLLMGHSGHPEGELLDLPGRETLVAAIGCFHSGGEPSMLRRAYPYLAALSRLPAWRFLHGAEPTTRLDVAATHLERVSEELEG